MGTDELVLSLVVGVALLAAFALFFKVLWNSTLPNVLGVNPVNAWQAFKILLIAAMLFGGYQVFLIHERGGTQAPPAPASGAAR